MGEISLLEEAREQNRGILLVFYATLCVYWDLLG